MKKIIFVLVLFGIGIFVSCNKDEQTIPAYLHISKIDVVPNPDLNKVPEHLQDSGFLSSSITTVWVAVDGNQLGAFELPCTIPVLKTGKHNITIHAGVKQNGMTATRIPYPYYKTIQLGNIEFVPNKEIRIDTTLHTKYANSTQFKIWEKFESPSHDFDSSMVICTNSDTVKYGLGCGAIYFGDKELLYVSTTDSIEVTSEDMFYLEMDYLCNESFEVGLTGYSSKLIYAGQSNTVMVMKLRPTNGEWRKVYIVLGRIFPQMEHKDYVKLVFKAINPNKNPKASIYFDNVKVLSNY